MASLLLRPAARRLPSLRHMTPLAAQVRGTKKSEEFTFDFDEVPQTLEQERTKFEDFAGLFGELRFNKSGQAAGQERREYVASRDPADWSYVQRYVDCSKPRLVPVPEDRPDNPSGFVMPSAKPGDYPYFVRRTSSWLMPVYVDQIGGINKRTELVILTKVKRIEGDIAKLREDLSEFLEQRYEQVFPSQADEILQTIRFRGNFEKDFKDFLKIRGF